MSDNYSIFVFLETITPMAISRSIKAARSLYLTRGCSNAKAIESICLARQRQYNYSATISPLATQTCLVYTVLSLFNFSSSVLAAITQRCSIVI